MLGIAGYEPTLIASATELLEREGDNLSRLVGQTLECSWVVWEPDDDEWFDDGPIILSFGGRHLELCACNLDQFAVTWDAIDLSLPIEWPWPEWHLVWKQDALPEIANIINKRVVAIYVTEYRFMTNILYERIEPSNIGRVMDHGWLLNGLEFEFEDGWLSIYNGLDTNAVAGTHATGADLRGTRIERSFDCT